MLQEPRLITIDLSLLNNMNNTEITQSQDYLFISKSISYNTFNIKHFLSEIDNKLELIDGYLCNLDSLNNNLVDFHNEELLSMLNHRVRLRRNFLYLKEFNVFQIITQDGFINDLARNLHFFSKQMLHQQQTITLYKLINLKNDILVLFKYYTSLRRQVIDLRAYYELQLLYMKSYQERIDSLIVNCIPKYTK